MMGCVRGLAGVGSLLFPGPVCIYRVLEIGTTIGGPAVFEDRWNCFKEVGLVSIKNVHFNLVRPKMLLFKRLSPIPGDAAISDFMEVRS